MAAQYVLGIDLGTTNSVLAYTRLDSERAEVQLLPIPQLVAAGTIEARTTLPSFAYLALDQEVASGAFDLPWQKQVRVAVGEFARRQSAEVPDRTISAAKSWLCHNRVDRHQAILPWNAPADVPKLSPVTASQRYLEHLVSAWEHAHPEAPVAEQVVVLTVPASFDASARELTREAALAAGLPTNLVLLEEPQAAVYAWLTAVGDAWRKQLKVGDRLLVCDVGGGTTDLTLVGAAEENGELTLRRLAVGNHLLIGGDNMDLTLAHYVAGKFAEKGTKLDPWQSVALWHSCRAAKEALLSPGGSPTHTISVLGRGSRLIGGTVSVEIEKAEVSKLLVEGFFPDCAVTDKPKKARASGFQEIGLPYESDTAITRHLAAFLQAHDEPEKSALPTDLLFNGGVFKADPLRERLVSVLENWAQATASEKPTSVLAGEHDLDHAVARGAAYYGFTKERGGLRIRGGTGRAYYVGIETAGLAIPGAPRPLRALCVVPFGMEEGTECDVPSSQVGLVVGEPAAFRFFSSSTRKQDRPGELVSHWSEDEIVESDSLEATLPADPQHADGNYVPVRFQAKLTELGIFELWCVGATPEERWKLEFSVRDDND